MSERNLFAFLERLSRESGALETLKTKSKADVAAAGAAYGLPFTEAEYDWFVWALEERLAARRGEAFAQHFSLWETMWGKYYLEFVVNTLLPSLTPEDVDAVLASRGG